MERLACAAVASIGVLAEGPLHAAVKALLASPGDRFEVPVGRCVIDLVRSDGELVEVQTGTSAHSGGSSTGCWTTTGCGSSIRSRPSAGSSGSTSTASCWRAPLAEARDGRGGVRQAGRLPVAAHAPQPHDRGPAPARGPHPRAEPTTTRRRTRDPGSGGSSTSWTGSRCARPRTSSPACLALPPEPFTTREPAALRCSTLLAQRTLYCLRAIGIVEPAGKRGRAPLHALAA